MSKAAGRGRVHRIRTAFACVLTAWLVLIGLALGEHVSKLSAQSRNTARDTKSSPARALRLPSPSYQYATVDLPAHFRNPAAMKFDNTPSENPVTDAGATLGRVLF